MGMTVEIAGLNLERLLSMAAESGIFVRCVRRIGDQTIRLCLPRTREEAFACLCDRYGWEMRLVKPGSIQRCIGAAKKRPLVLLGLALYVLIVWISSSMILGIRIDHAGKNLAEVRSYLASEKIAPFRLKAFVSTSALRDALMLRLPDLAYVSVGYEGSRLVVDCQPSLEGERTAYDRACRNIVASQDGIITQIVAYSGTPVVAIGQAVCAGDVLIRGEERGEQQTPHAVDASGVVKARVWARGEARVSRYTVRTVETGALRRRVSICLPWYRKLVTDAAPFRNQDVSVERVPVVGLYLPLWREIETLAEIESIREEREISDAVSVVQGAAEQQAKNKCPPGVHILDKTVENSMIDNEYVYGAVVLEYESDIAMRAAYDETQE